MVKTATPHQIRSSLQSVLTELQGPNPSREKVANDLQNIVIQLVASDSRVASTQALPAIVSPKSIEAWLSGIRLSLGDNPSAAQRDEVIDALKYALFVLRKNKAVLPLVTKELEKQKLLQGQ